jgi:hypothetical protein
VARRNPKPSEERPPDLEIGATARAKRLRFEEEPETSVEFRGESIAESESGSERQNLPDEVEPDVTYRDVRIGWRAAAWVENAAEDRDEDERS